MDNSKEIRRGVYKVTNPEGKVYIGQSCDIYRRFREYRGLRCKGQVKLFYSLTKYGSDAHEYLILEEVDTASSQDFLDQLEIKYWNLYRELEVDLLNLREPGKGGRHSEETRLKISRSSLGKVQSEDHRRKNSEGHKGKKQTPESNLKRSLKLKGREGISRPAWNKGLSLGPRSEEVKKKISESCLNLKSKQRTNG